jgi:hypothetical protein
MALKATSLEVLRITVSIGAVKTNHLSLSQDEAGNAVAQPLSRVTDPKTGLRYDIRGRFRVDRRTARIVDSALAQRRDAAKLVAGQTD